MARFNMTYHGSPSAQSIMSQGFRPGGIMSVAPGQVFSTPNYGFASGYGKPVGMVTSKSAFSMPSMNFSTGNLGSEVVQSPKAATRGMNLANKLGTTYTSSRAKDLMSGRTVSGLGGSTPGNLMRALGIMGSLPAQAALMSLSPTPANADEINMGPEDFANLANAEVTPQTYSNIPELTQLIDDNPDINSLAEAQEYANQNRPNMSDIAGLGDLGNPTGDSRVVSEEMGMTGTPNFGRPSMADIAGQVNENLIDRGNPFNDSRVVSEEQSLVGGIPDRGRSGAFANPGEMGAFEMIGGTPVAIGDVLGRQQALEKADFYEEPTTQRNAFNDLLGLASLAYTGPYQGLVKGANLFNNIRTGKVGQIAKGLGSLGSKFAGKMRGINPITGRANTQSEYNQARAERQQQSRVDNVAARLAANKKTLSDPYSIAKTKEQREQIRDAKVEGAKKDTSMGETGYGSCFIAGTKVTMADGTFKNIEDVKVGDKIKGHKEDNTVIKLDPTLLGDRKLYSFNNNQHYFFTSEHPFMTEEGWKSIKPEKTKERDGVELYDQLKGELKVGDKLVTDNGLVEITNIDSKEMNSPEMSLYNFNVSNDNSYIADGYVVHNKGGGGGKIVCTMMNERYGFGSFRNKIWMKFHEHHGPEYQKGYHAIFLPLVKIAKGEGKINTAVRKVLEHMGRHVTADMFKIMKGKKRDTLGRIYRAIFEPACHIIGKIKSALGRG